MPEKQAKTGYIRGVRGIVITPILESGAPAVAAASYGINTAQQIGVEAVVVTGATDELRGGDKLLAHIEDNDIVTGMKLNVQDAKVDLMGLTKMAGGTLVKKDDAAIYECSICGEVYDPADHGDVAFSTLDPADPCPGETAPAVACTGTYADYELLEVEVTGWISPSMVQQQNKPVFKAEVYAANHDSGGVIMGFIKYEFFYCQAVIGNITLQDKAWMVPAFSIKCKENPTVTGGPYRKDFVDVLPAELTQPWPVA